MKMEKDDDVLSGPDVLEPLLIFLGNLQFSFDF
jgi:hypothetical protein